MDMNRKNAFSYFLIALMPLSILTLGLWWLFLLHKLSLRLGAFEKNPFEINWVRMIQWEGGLFFLILLISTISFIWIFLQNIKKTKRFQIFLMAIGHDLKTPLSLLRLTSELIQEEIVEFDSSSKEKKNLTQLGDQLILDAKKFEFEFDKLLYFSRIHFSKTIPLEVVDIQNILPEILGQFPSLEFHLELENHPRVLANAYCIHLILKNFMSNTVKHSSCRNVLLGLKEGKNRNEVQLYYEEIDTPFLGNTKKLGSLFYKKEKNAKGKSPIMAQASIGLYLAKQLVIQMKGKIEFLKTPNLRIEISFIRK